MRLSVRISPLLGLDPLGIIINATWLETVVAAVEGIADEPKDLEDTAEPDAVERVVPQGKKRTPRTPRKKGAKHAQSISEVAVDNTVLVGSDS